MFKLQKPFSGDVLLDYQTLPNCYLTIQWLLCVVKHASLQTHGETDKMRVCCTGEMGISHLFTYDRLISIGLSFKLEVLKSELVVSNANRRFYVAFI